MENFIFNVGGVAILFFVFRPIFQPLFDEVVGGIVSQFEVCELLQPDWIPLEEVCRRVVRTTEVRTSSALAKIVRGRTLDMRGLAIFLRGLSHGVVFQYGAERWDVWATLDWIEAHDDMLTFMTEDERRRCVDRAEWAANVLAKRVGESWRERVQRLKQVLREHRNETHIEEMDEVVDPETSPDAYMHLLERDIQICLCQFITLMRRKPTVPRGHYDEDSIE